MAHVCFSLSHRTDEDSFQKVKNWVKELKKMLGSEIVLTIVGNKLDLTKDRNVPVDTAEGWVLRFLKSDNAHICAIPAEPWQN